jgi:hypothetical protein
MSIEKGIEESRRENNLIQTRQMLLSLVQKEQYVGDVYSINYETASVIIHDYYRQKVGGIPSLCFLIATRVSLHLMKT